MALAAIQADQGAPYISLLDRPTGTNEMGATLGTCSADTGSLNPQSDMAYSGLTYETGIMFVCFVRHSKALDL